MASLLPADVKASDSPFRPIAC